MSKPDRLLQLRNTPVEAIQVFRTTRRSEIIPVDMQQYILQMDTVARLTHTNNFSVREAMDQLCREFPGLTPAAARDVYYDALEYFYFDERLSATTWDAVYAQQMEDLKTLAISANKLETAYKCLVKAHEYRTMQRESTEVDWRPPVFIINMTVKPEDLGFKSQKLMDIARRNEDQQFEQMIGSLPIPDADKDRLRTDAGILISRPTNTIDDDTDEQ